MCLEGAVVCFRADFWVRECDLRVWQTLDRAAIGSGFLLGMFFMSELFGSWYWMGGVAFLTLVATCFGYIRTLYLHLFSRVVQTLTVSGFQADAALLYLRHHYSVSQFGPRTYLGWKLFFRPARRVQLMPMEVTSEHGRLYWRRWCPVWVTKASKNVNDLETGVTANDYQYQTLNILFACGTLDPDAFILQATQYYNQQTQVYDATDGRRHSIRFIHGSAGMMMADISSSRGRDASCPTSGSDIRGCLVNRPLGFAFSQLGLDPNQGRSAVDRLALSGEAQLLVTEIRRWHESEVWYEERQLPWRRGFLLYGPPGTGKTALARAVAEDLDLPVYVFDLASLKNDELQRAWNQMLEQVPCLALIEDIDAVFHGRKNVAITSGPGLTFDCLLNCLDGVQRSDGLLTIITTNHLDQVDPAIAQPGAIGTRPGRIDRVIHLDGMDEVGRRKIARRVLRDRLQHVSEVCRQGQSDTPAQFQERCARLAIALHYGDDVDGMRREPREDATEHTIDPLGELPEPGDYEVELEERFVPAASE